MKQSFYTLTVAIFLALCTACTEADIVLPVIGGEDGSGQGNGGGPDKGVSLAINELNLSLTAETRAGGLVTGRPQNTVNNPNPVKKIGVMVTNTRYPRAYYDPAIPIKVFNYNEASGAWLQDGSTPMLYLGTDQGYVYPFAPSDKVPMLDGILENGYPSVGGIEVKAAQTFRFHDTGPVDPATDVPWDTDQEDYLCVVGSGYLADRWNPDLSILLKHALAKVSFRVMEKDGGTLYAGSKVVKVELKGIGGNAPFRISKPAGPSDPGTVMDIYHGWIVTQSTVPAGSLTFTAAPGTARVVGSGKTIPAEVPVQAFGLVKQVMGEYDSPLQATAELTLDDGHVFTTSPFEVDWGSDFGNSNHYIYTLRLDPKGITIGKPQVAGWDETVPEQNVPMEPVE